MNVSYRHVPRQDQEKAGVFAANCENCGHFFKYRTVAPFKTSVTFTVNGVSYTGTKISTVILVCLSVLSLYVPINGYGTAASRQSLHHLPF